jgi:hypothetical protein
LPLLATVRAVPIATRAATAFTGTRPVLAVVVAAATARVRAFDATVAAALVVEIARRATLLVDARLELAATGVVDTFLRECCAREREEPESDHQNACDKENAWRCAEKSVDSWPASLDEHREWPETLPC